MNDIEQLLKNLPKHRADSVFADSLKQRIMRDQKKSVRGWRLFPQLAVLLTTVLLMIGGFAILNGQPRQTNQLTDLSAPAADTSISQEMALKAPNEFNLKPNVLLATGFGFHIPTTWSAKIANESKSHFAGRFFLPNVNTSTTYVDIESMATSQQITNPWLIATTTNKKTINNLAVTEVIGKEHYQNSGRLITQMTFTRGGTTLVATLYQSPSDNAQLEFEQLIQSVSPSQPVSYHRFIGVVYAAEAIAGIPVETFKKITVMGDPLPERISTSDPVYKDGFGKFYQFDALKGQRLTTVALEDRTTNPNSFIRSELYDQEGNVIGKIADTRIEFNAPYTGTYYLIVHSFQKRVGGFLLKVFDFDQTANQVYAKFADGSEQIVDYRTERIQVGAKEAAIVFQFQNPVELINGQIRYFRKAEEFENPLGLITTTLRVYQKEDSLNGPWLTIEGDPSYEVPVRFTQVSPSKVLIEPTSGGFFPKNYQIAVSEQVPVATYGWVVRFFTEEYRPRSSGSSSPAASWVPVMTVNPSTSSGVPVY